MTKLSRISRQLDVLIHMVHALDYEVRRLQDAVGIDRKSPAGARLPEAMERLDEIARMLDSVLIWSKRAASRPSAAPPKKPRP